MLLKHLWKPKNCCTAFNNDDSLPVLEDNILEEIKSKKGYTANHNGMNCIQWPGQEMEVTGIIQLFNRSLNGQSLSWAL